MPKTMNPTHQPRSARTHWSCFVARRASTTSETSSAPSSDAATAKNVLSDPDRVTCGAVISASHHAAAAHANGKYATKARPSTGAPLRASSVRSINTAIANQKVARTMRVNALSSSAVALATAAVRNPATSIRWLGVNLQMLLTTSETDIGHQFDNSNSSL